MSGRLADAILVGRDLLKRNPQILDVRLPSHPQLDATCGRPSAGVPVFEHIAGGSSIEAAVQAQASLEHGGEYRIVRKEIPADAASVPSEDGDSKSADRIIRSILLRYETRADILIVDNLNPCWKRFALCKEFAHLIMDDSKGVRAMSVEKQIADAMDIARSPDPDTELSSEAFAWFTAVEMLLPIADRKSFMARHGAGEDHLTLARSYWVPRAIVDLFFRTPYLEVSNSIQG